MSTLRIPNINQVALSGRLVQNPDLQFTDKGSARLRERIAVNRSYRDRNKKRLSSISCSGRRPPKLSASACTRGRRCLYHGPLAEPLLAR